MDTIKVWNYLNGNLLKTLCDFLSVNSLIILSNNEFSSGSSDDLIRIWSQESH